MTWDFDWIKQHFEDQLKRIKIFDDASDVARSSSNTGNGLLFTVSYVHDDPPQKLS